MRVAHGKGTYCMDLVPIHFSCLCTPFINSSTVSVYGFGKHVWYQEANLLRGT